MDTTTAKMPMPTANIAPQTYEYLFAVPVNSYPQPFTTLWEKKVDSIRAEFSDLVAQWLDDTRHLSVLSKKITHPAYFRIIGMGEFAISLVLKELRDRPSHWFVALEAISGENPVAVPSNPGQARASWLQWGRQKGFIEAE